MPRNRQLAFNLKERDTILDHFETIRIDLLKRAKEIAIQIAERNGSVTSPQVVQALEFEKAPGLEHVDKRFMGGVFRGGWERIGFRSEGSHGQAVSVWKPLK